MCQLYSKPLSISETPRAQTSHTEIPLSPASFTPQYDLFTLQYDLYYISYLHLLVELHILRAEC